ncbi:coiled-coil domain-containing protein 200-like [Chaetodon trifascialis]|uniref:coiled-coil domain-containing protein 200-like n=1 Tax=Chaetodon trifascialis TaxID=109706 RepID=UPI0039921F56
MSAMHWEARRRQSALDRRMAKNQQQLLQRGSETSHNTTETNPIQEYTAGDQCPHCKGNLKTPVQYSGKIPNRYSSLQYTQQW